MENTEPEKQILEKAERNRDKIRPLKRLLLLDVMSDKESRPVLFYWAGGMLLGGVLVYHWLEGWELYRRGRFLCRQPGDRRLWRLYADHAARQAIHDLRSDQRHCHPAGAVRPPPGCARAAIEGPAEGKRAQGERKS